jgi:hypothetical protein
MQCKSCASINLREFISEICIRFPGLKNINKATVWIFPELMVCSDCGRAEFFVPEAELRLLGEGEATATE